MRTLKPILKGLGQVALCNLATFATILITSLALDAEIIFTLGESGIINIILFNLLAVVILSNLHAWVDDAREQERRGKLFKRPKGYWYE